MKPRRMIPHLAALLLLAWILGSLARSGTRGGSILSNSYWLVYALELLPLIALGLMVALGVYLAINWRLMSDVLGFGMAGRRKVLRKKNRTLGIMVWGAAWAVAIGVMMIRCGTPISAVQSDCLRECRWRRAERCYAWRPASPDSNPRTCFGTGPARGY